MEVTSIFPTSIGIPARPLYILPRVHVRVAPKETLRAECRRAYQLTVSTFVDMVRGLKLFPAGALPFRVTIGAREAAVIVHHAVIAEFLLALAR